jgi:transposase-like protein
MAERKYEAKERTVNKMTPGGLGEEPLGLHDNKREGEVSTDAGILRHPQNANDWRRLYAESDADNTPESSQSTSTNKQRQRQYRQVDRQEKHNSTEQETGSPEGGTFRNERSYEDNGTR